MAMKNWLTFMKIWPTSPEVFRSPRCFVWANEVYVYNAAKPLKRLYMVEPMVSQLKLEKGRWIRFNAELLSECRFPKGQLLLSNNEKVLLVQHLYRKWPRPYFSLWRLSDEGSRFVQDAWKEDGNGALGNRFLLKREEAWEKVEMRSLRGTVKLAGHNLVGATYEGQHISFAFRDGTVKDKGSVAHKLLRYSLATDD